MAGAVRPGGWIAFSHRRGFTLVEILVVTAIVVVLAGVTAGMLPGLFARVQRADALAKTRTMGLAVLQYPVDHGGKLPPLVPGKCWNTKKAVVAASSRSVRPTLECQALRRNTWSARLCPALTRDRPFRPTRHKCAFGS